jgi:hypothetical protein
MLCDVEGRDERLADVRERELFEIELSRLAQIRDRLFDRLALVVVPVSGFNAVYPPSGAGIRTAVSIMSVLQT